jgi:hypothetical protein
MSELIAPQQQLAAAISQLFQGSSNNQLTAEAVNIVVRRLTGNQFVIANGSREIVLPRRQLAGDLNTGQNYQAVLTQSTNNQTNESNTLTASSPALRFFTRSNLSLDIPLNNVQGQSLISNLPATIQRQITNTAQILTARILQVTPSLLTVGLDNTGRITNTLAVNQLTLAIPTADASQNLVPNQTVQLRLTTENNNLNVTIGDSRQVFQRSPLGIQNPNQTLRSADTPTPSTTLISQFLAKPVNTNLQGIVPALRVAINESQASENRSSNTNITPQASRSADTSQPSNTQLSFVTNGLSIKVETDVEQATFNRVTPQQSRQLNALSIRATGANPSDNQAKVQEQNTNAHGIQQSIIQETTKKVPPTDETPSELFLRQVISSGSRQNTLNQVQSLIRQTRPLTDSPSSILRRIETALSDSEVSQSSEIEKLTSNIKRQLRQSLPGGGIEDSNIIRQLLSAAPATTSQAITTFSQTNNTLISGLVGLLQITLASRLSQSNAKAFERITQVLSSQLSPGLTSRNARPQITRNLSDIVQLDQKHLLLRELGKFFAGHQNYKLSSIEQQLNSQDGFYYVLPSAFGEQRTDIELLIKRQQEQEKTEKNEGFNSRAWKVSMKLDIGEKGQLLAKATLKEKEVELDFYVSNPSLKSLVFDFIPHLKTRLDTLGIHMSKHHCQLGKIPDSLQRRPYHILETRA